MTFFLLIDGGANIKDFLTENNSSYNQHLSISYYTRGMCYDQHTLSMVGVDNSAYMSSSCYRMGNNNNWLGVQNRTSDSVSYSWGVGPADPGSYPVSNSFANSWSPAMMADGGIFIFNQHRYNNASHRTMILLLVGHIMAVRCQVTTRKLTVLWLRTAATYNPLT